MWRDSWNAPLDVVPLLFSSLLDWQLLLLIAYSSSADLGNRCILFITTEGICLIRVLQMHNYWSGVLVGSLSPTSYSGSNGTSRSEKGS
jgi:hypothetical protein